MQDECVLLIHDCHANAVCTDEIHGYSCACNSGYTGSGIQCTSVPECTAGLHNCAATASCTDTPASFTCACNAGWVGSGITCANANECALQTHNCHSSATCTDLAGSFGCICAAGFELIDSTRCGDADECAQSTHNCSVNALCANTVGGFRCSSSIPDRAVVRFRVRNATGQTAVEIAGALHAALRLAEPDRVLVVLDALLSRRRSTGGGANVTIETNVSGINDTLTAIGNVSLPDNMTLDGAPSWQPANCNAGYVGDGVVCTNVNECDGSPAPCGPPAECVDTDGSFECECGANFRYVDTGCVAVVTARAPHTKHTSMYPEQFVMIAVLAGMLTTLILSVIVAILK